MKNWLTILFFAVILSNFTLTGCSSNSELAADPENNSSAASTSRESVAPNSPSNSSTAQADILNMNNYKPRLEGKATVEMQINGSTITIEVDGDNAPITAGNFVDLVERGVYNGLTFHRVINDPPQPFVAQGGDPKGNGTGGFIDPETKKERTIPLEIKLEGQEEPNYRQTMGRSAGFSAPSVVLNHKRGAVAMARSQMPDSASSQFYFALSDLDFLDGDYAVFGYVTEGMEAVDQIKQGDRIQSAKVVTGLENLKK